MIRIIEADVVEGLAQLAGGSVHCVVTSPPYWGLRDYGVDGQIGLEPTPEAYAGRMVAVFREVRRVLRDDGTLWLNLGDSYASQGGPEPAQTKWQVDGASKTQNAGRSRSPGALKPKDLCGIPWRVAFALQADGWWLRSDIIWSKPNPMPESVTDRPTRAHEYVFLLSKSKTYYYDADAIREPVSPFSEFDRGGAWREQQEIATPYGEANRKAAGLGNGSRGDPAGRNKRTVWTIPTQPFPGAHFATFPEALVKPCIQAGCPEGGTVLDPFAGSGTVGVVAQKAGRSAVLIDVNPEYCQMMRERLAQGALL